MASEPPGWTFLSNHGHVLVALAIDPYLRMREVAEKVGITERSVQLIVRDLERAGYLQRERMGRRNHYTLVPRTRFRHPLEAHVQVAAFLALVAAGREPPPTGVQLAAGDAEDRSRPERPGS